MERDETLKWEAFCTEKERSRVPFEGWANTMVKHSEELSRGQETFVFVIPILLAV
jgi:hypothetical protein